MARTQAATAAALRIRGVVQGVGFRPFVHRLALRHGLTGWVRNEAGSVHILVEGTPDAITAFTREVRSRAPALARIDELRVEETEGEGHDTFRVIVSDTTPAGRLPVSPDVATCPECTREMLDPDNRRYRYPFITCTDCGPRFTVIESMPYDRERTTMRVFRQCPECLREYGDPADRRYHSETNSCPACGPSLWLETDGNVLHRNDAALHAAAALLREGGVLALKGLGGFHLAVDAASATAVERLRRRKHREAKPLALMAPDLSGARTLGEVGPVEARLLTSRERPILLLRRQPDAPLAEGVAPNLDTVGVMLPYTPLHHLLLEAFGGALVMTSGNLSDEPIAIANAEARKRLGHIADAFLLHDREIVARYDDSLLRVVDDGPIFLRRARGYAPLPVSLPVPAPCTILAVGPHLKNTFTLAHGAWGWVSQHVGDLESLETLEHFQDSLARFRTLFHLDPEAVVRDLHPGYLSTRVAEGTGLPRLEPVQHHHAHIAAVMAEHGITDPVLGLAFDGTGYGDDGRVWGCEFLRVDLTGYTRLAHLRYAPLPGGDLAARRPWRTALGYAWLAGAEGEDLLTSLGAVAPEELRLAREQIRAGVNAPLASSLGRLFDAAAAVLGVRTGAQYEGQAAMELEALAGDLPARVVPLPAPAVSSASAAPPPPPYAPAPYAPAPGAPDAPSPLVLDPLPLLLELARRRRKGVPVTELAATFHESIISAAVSLALRLCEAEGLDTVALGGGCFQNARLLAGVRRGLEEGGRTVLIPRALSPNDGAISYGQAAVAAARMNL